MDELARELASLGDAVVPAWDEARSERLLAGVAQLRRRRRVQRVVSSGALALAACGLLFLQLQRDASASGAQLNAAARTAERGLQEPGMGPHLLGAAPVDRGLAQLPLQLADGSHVQSLVRGAAVFVERNEPARIGLRLDAGGARFDVVPNTQREFVVRAGSVEVAVLGTIFEVERDGARVRVSVTRGKVRVRAAAGAQGAVEPTILMPGESGWFDDVRSRDAATRELAPRDTAATPRESAAREERSVQSERLVAERERPAKAHARGNHRAVTTREEAPRAAWRSLSQSGDYEGAYRLLLQETIVEDDSGALLDAADAARLSGHPQAAVQYLRKVVDQHRETPVAPLAAFTLGRVLLERLGQPSEAAEAFSTARRLAPAGSLAQDALAREVEAWSKAGHPDEAYRCAREYVEKYPQGRRLRSVQLYGGMQVP
jgi:transmembrane sensor